MTDAVTAGDLHSGDAHDVVVENASPQPLRELRRVPSPALDLVAVEDSVQPVQWDRLGGADGVDEDVGLVVGDHYRLLDCDELPQSPAIAWSPLWRCSQSDAFQVRAICAVRDCKRDAPARAG